MAFIKQTLDRLAALPLPTLRDLHVYVGGALMAAGVGQWWAPGAYITLGAVLLARGVWRMS